MGSLRYLGDNDVRAALDIGEVADPLTTALVALSDGATSAPPRVAAVAADEVLGAILASCRSSGSARADRCVFPAMSSPVAANASGRDRVVDPDTGSRSPCSTRRAGRRAVRTAVTSALARRPGSPRQPRTGDRRRGGPGPFTPRRVHRAVDDRRDHRCRRSRQGRGGGGDARRGARCRHRRACRAAGPTSCAAVPTHADPVVEDEWIADGTHVSSVGSGRELAPPTIERGFLVVESAVSCPAPTRRGGRAAGP